LSEYISAAWVMPSFFMQKDAAKQLFLVNLAASEFRL